MTQDDLPDTLWDKLPPGITPDELIRALKKTYFLDPGNGAGGGSLPSIAGTSAADIAYGLFQAVAAQRDEASRWVVGGLYLNDTLTPPGEPLVYRRVEDGWRSLTSGAYLSDGAVDTTGFRGLIPEGAPAGPSRLSPGANLLRPYDMGDRRTRHIHAEQRAGVPGCPACFPGPSQHIHGAEVDSMEDCPACHAEYAAKNFRVGGH